MGLPPAFFFFFLFLAHGSCQQNITLGFLYYQQPTSWLQESWAQFKLAVQDVNSAQDLLPQHNLTYKLADSGGNERDALRGAVQLLDQGVHAIVGTGYSSALAAPSLYSSMQQTLIVSPGSNAISLIDKSRYPFLFRVLSNSASDLKAMAVVTFALGWRKVATLTASEWEMGAIQVLHPALKALDVDYLVLAYSGLETQTGKRDLNRSFALISNAGYHVVLLYGKTVDAEVLHELSGAHGLRSARHCWFMLQPVFEGSWLSTPNVLVARPKGALDNPVKNAFAARWPTVTTRYNESLHGAWDPVTKMPFYGSNVYTDVVFDTDYAPVGDGVPDVWGMVAYDTVWLLAKAFHAVIQAGFGVDNGEKVREALLEVQHSGVTGNLSFDQSTQDGSTILLISITNATGPAPSVVPVASTTAAIATGSPGDGSWCLTGGCLDSNLTITTKALPWQGGRQPSDGRALDREKSEGIVGPLFTEGSRIDITVSARDSYGQPCCVDTCSADASDSICQICRTELAAYDQLQLVARDDSGQEVSPLEPAAPMQVDTQAGRITLTLPAGFAGAGVEDRRLWLQLLHRGEVIPIGGQASKEITLLSRACPKGSAGTNSVCTQCLPGRVAPERGLSACQACATGKSQNLIGEAHCMNCSAGYLTETTGQSECSACPAGRYQAAQGRSSCQACPTGMTTLQMGSNGFAACVCTAGSFWPVGSTLAEGTPQGICEDCPPGMSCQAGADSRNFSSQAAASGSTASQPLGVLPGHWSDPLEPLSVFRCLYGLEQCPGGSPNSCGEHLHGRACVTCEAGHYRNEGHCAECPSEAISRVLFPIIPVVLSLVVVYPFHKITAKIHNDESWNLGKRSVVHIAAITVSELQIAGLLLNSNLESRPQSSKTWNIVNEPLGLLQPECAGVKRFEHMVTLRLLLPAWCFLAFVIAGMEAAVLGKLTSRGKIDIAVLWGQFGAAFIAFYTAICAISMDLFKCYGHPNGEYTMISASNILCYHSEWGAMVAWASVAILVYCVLSLAVFTWILRIAPYHMEDSTFLKRWNFLLAKFRPRERWWSIVWLVKSILLNLTQVVTFEGQNQLWLLQFVLILYVAATLFYRPWRHLDANIFDALAHFMPAMICGQLYWYAPAGSEEFGRKFLVEVSLGLPLFFSACLIAFRLINVVVLPHSNRFSHNLHIKSDKSDGSNAVSTGSSRSRQSKSVTIYSKSQAVTGVLQVADLIQGGELPHMRQVLGGFARLNAQEMNSVLRQLCEQDRKTLLDVLTMLERLDMPGREARQSKESRESRELAGRLTSSAKMEEDAQHAQGAQGCQDAQGGQGGQDAKDAKDAKDASLDTLGKPTKPNGEPTQDQDLPPTATSTPVEDRESWVGV